MVIQMKMSTYIAFLMQISRPQKKKIMEFPFYIFGVQPDDGYIEVAETCRYYIQINAV